ncbi:dual specificity protein phosphatase 13A isoform X2 [Neopsephotus bourkii]|uniref:dual specificity protein phosphatase 13A isoform X2 n=1 Tax=Neopsephotus bourkii TaxID=309878 RepID=UPI002AA50B49|nr:dual specificity protein phosphatase 13A isoform X2 [Neopsephotus bourkii]
MHRQVASPGERAQGIAQCRGSVALQQELLPGTCLSPSPCSPRDHPRGWQRPSTQCPASGCWEEDLSLALGMSGVEVLGSQEPEGPGTCMEDVPSIKEIEQLLNTGRPSCNHVDEVWPNLFLGDLVTAHNRFVLWKMGVTHVLNAAHGTSYSHGGQDFYGATIDYYGVPAHDLPSFDISQFFFSAAQFIHNALNTPGEQLHYFNRILFDLPVFLRSGWNLMALLMQGV